MKMDENDRIKKINSYEILDTPRDGKFDIITELASQVFNVPIALISLVDHDRIWFKSHHGIETEQIDNYPGLCSSAILSAEVYIIESARNDPRCLANPLVASEMGLQFYAAAPLITKDNYALGTFCIIDRVPRFINQIQQELLQKMARIVMDQLETRLEARNLAKAFVTQRDL